MGTENCKRRSLLYEGKAKTRPLLREKLIAIGQSKLKQLLEYRETAFEENNLVAHGKEASVVAM
jgi:hypothetical protein